MNFNQQDRVMYGEFVRPRVAELLQLLGMDVSYVRAEGDLLYPDGAPGTSDSCAPVVDMLGGYGSTLLGHNHPDLVQALEQALAERVAVHAQASIRPGAARLAARLNALLAAHGPDARRFVVTFANSGAEAVEAGIKHALMEWQHRRQRRLAALELSGASAREIDGIRALEPVIVGVRGSFHGKTTGSVAVTSNADFREMYPHSPLQTVFLDPGDDLDAARARLPGHSPPGQASGFSAVAAILFEAVQGEGGIVPLSPAFARVLRQLADEHGAPLVADEIQCGLFRTGTLLGAHQLGLAPDYILLGKSLGGGLTKISALLVAEERYQPRFGLIHSSTFAEDELSSRVALRTLDLLDGQAASLAAAAERFERRVRERMAATARRHPGTVREVRGRGFLLGVELDFSETGRLPHLLGLTHQAGLATYLCASFLLERHRVRVGVTLSRPDTLRIEPSALVSDESTDRLLDGLEHLCGLLAAGRLDEVTRHLFGAEAHTVSPPSPPRPVRSADIPKVGFLCHIIDDGHLRRLDPLFAAMGRARRARFLAEFAPAVGPTLFHEQLVSGANGRTVHLHCYGSFLPSTFFAESHR